MNAVNISRGLTATMIGLSVSAVVVGFYGLSKELSKTMILKTGSIAIPIFTLMFLAVPKASQYISHRFCRQPISRPMNTITNMNLPFLLGNLFTIAYLRGLDVVASTELTVKISGAWTGIAYFTCAGLFFWQNRNVMTQGVQMIHQQIQHMKMPSIFSRFFTSSHVQNINNQTQTQTTTV